MNMYVELHFARASFIPITTIDKFMAQPIRILANVSNWFSKIVFFYFFLISYFDCAMQNEYIGRFDNFRLHIVFRDNSNNNNNHHRCHGDKCKLYMNSVACTSLPKQFVIYLNVSGFG